MKGNLRTLHRRFCLDSTVLGLKYFYLFPDKFSRCFWTAWICFILYIAVLITFLLYQRFEALPTRINIENQFEPVGKLPFPAITLCSPNQMTISGVKHFEKTLVNGNRTYELTNELRQLLGFYYFVYQDADQLRHLQGLIELNRYTVPEVMMQLPLSCDEFLRVCFFRRRQYPRCRGLFKPLLTNHGLCCAFNSIYYYETNRRNQRNRTFEPHLVKEAGVLNGLTVVTDYQPYDALDYSVQYSGAARPHLAEDTGVLNGLTVVTDYQPYDALDYSVQYSGAARIMFTDWTEFPTEDESMLLAPGTESFHFIHATTTYCSPDVRELPPTSRKCLLEDERTLPFFYKYRNSDCDMLCLIHAVEQVCHCLLLYLPHLRISDACGVTKIPCIMMVKLDLQNWQGECECPRDCDSRHYRVDTTVGNLDGLRNMFYPSFADLEINQSTSIMHFVFRTPVYEKQKQETVMSLITLASNLGGVFGLCLGCSVMSVLELLFYHYSAAKTCNQPRRKPLRSSRVYSYKE